MNATMRFHDLPLAGQLIVWASRHWLKAYADGRMIPRCVWQSFAHAGLLPVYSGLADALAVLAGYELDPRSFASPNSPRLTEAETCWVQFVLSEDRQTDWPSLRRGGRQPCPPIARAAAEHLLKVRRHFDSAGFNTSIVAAPPASIDALPTPVLSEFASALH